MNFRSVWQGGETGTFRTGGRRANPRYKSGKFSDNSIQVKVAEGGRVSQVEKPEKVVTKRSERDKRDAIQSFYN